MLEIIFLNINNYKVSLTLIKQDNKLMKIHLIINVYLRKIFVLNMYISNGIQLTSRLAVRDKNLLIMILSSWIILITLTIPIFLKITMRSIKVIKTFLKNLINTTVTKISVISVNAGGYIWIKMVYFILLLKITV